MEFLFEVARKRLAMTTSGSIIEMECMWCAHGDDMDDTLMMRGGYCARVVLYPNDVATAWKLMRQYGCHAMRIILDSGIKESNRMQLNLDICLNQTTFACILHMCMNTWQHMYSET